MAKSLRRYCSTWGLGQLRTPSTWRAPWHLSRHFERLPRSCCLQNQQFLRRSFPDRGERNAGIKSNEPSFMLNRKSKQVYVGQLPRSMNSGRVHEIRIQQTDFIRPEFMDILAAGLG